MNSKKLAFFILLGFALVPVSQAQIKHIEIRVEGMTWNFWAYGVKQHLGRQSGVQSVEVSLINGKVEIVPKEDGRIDPPQLLKAVYDSWVSVAEMDITGRGRIARDASGNLVLNVSPNESFAVAPGELSKELEQLADSPTTVTIRGQLYKTPEGKKKPKLDPSARLKLLILEIQTKE